MQFHVIEFIVSRAQYAWSLKSVNAKWRGLDRSEQSEYSELFNSIEVYIISSLFDSLIVFVKIVYNMAPARIILIYF